MKKVDGTWFGPEELHPDCGLEGPLWLESTTLCLNSGDMVFVHPKTGVRYAAWQRGFDHRPLLAPVPPHEPVTDLKALLQDSYSDQRAIESLLKKVGGR